jgi:hypothetical protein
MMLRLARSARTRLVLALAVGALLSAAVARAHCDTLDGPVVTEARAALAAGDVTPLLKWVRSEDEPEIRAAFARTLAVRSGGDAARELADTWFFETLVRVHRTGEGAPYTGLEPAGTAVDPAVRLADRALETGSTAALVEGVTSSVREGLERRFAEASARRKHAAESVEAGRAYVASYVEFVHYAERLHQAAVGSAHADPAEAPSPEAHAAHAH